MASKFEIQPFTAANIQRLDDNGRREALTKIGLGFLRRNRLLRWDESDPAFAFDLAEREYDRVIDGIARASIRRAA